jgi:hypothetical protein
VARIELKSGRWVEYRTDLMAGDQFEVQDSFTVNIGADGSRTMPGGITSIMRRALLGQIVTAWGGPGLDGIPIPSVSPEGTAIMGRMLTIADMNELAAAVQPLLDQVVPTEAPNPQKAATTPSSS